LRKALKYLQAGSSGKSPLQTDDPAVWGTLFAWLFTRKLGKLLYEENYDEQSRSWIDEWMLGKIIANALQDMELSQEAAWRQVNLVKLLTSSQGWCAAEGNEKADAYAVLQSWLKDESVQAFLSINRYQGVLWFNKESFEEMLWWLFAVSVADKSPAYINPEETNVVVDWQGWWRTIAPCFEIIEKLQAAEALSDFQVEKLLATAKV
jgi:hypothetical protein